MYRTIFTLHLASVLATFASAAEPTLPDLLKQYQAHGLPLPPKDATLERLVSGHQFILNGEVQESDRSLVFRIRNGAKDRMPLVLQGTQEIMPDASDKLESVPPDPSAMRNIEFETEEALIIAIQCHAAGFEKLAEALLEQSRKAANRGRSLDHIAWEHWLDQLTKPKLDRALVLARLKMITQTEPAFQKPYHRGLIKSLQLAMAPSKAKPGTVEELIDKLVDYNSDETSRNFADSSDPYTRLAELGFDAVPALISHISDNRLTRDRSPRFNNFPEWNRRVGDVVCDLIEGLADSEIERGTAKEGVGSGSIRALQGFRLRPVAVKKWWDDARALGEEKYLLANVLPAPESSGEWPNAQILRVIEIKYPKHLPELYHRVLNKQPGVNGWPIVEAIIRSKLPKVEKKAFLLEGCKHPQLRHRRAALDNLKDVDRPEFLKALLTTIEKLPRDVDGPYWLSDERHMSRLAVDADDPKIWAALEKAIRRAKFGLRMELLRNLAEVDGPRGLRERFTILAAYLDDSELRVESTDRRFEGPSAGFPYDRIEVRDFVAIEISRLLGHEVPLDLKRTLADWAQVREQVRKGLKLELEKLK